MILEKGKWYMREGTYASPAVWCIPETYNDTYSDWVEIEPLAIVKKKRDLSHAKVGEKYLVIGEHNTMEVIHVGDDYVVVKLINSDEKDTFTNTRVCRIPERVFHKYEKIGD